MNDTNPTPADSSEATSESLPTTPAKPQSESLEPKQRLDPVRYGDWEKNGRCIDF